MSYTLEIFALDWRKLGEALAGGLAPPDPYMPAWRRLNPDMAEQAALARTWAAAASELKQRLDEGDGDEDHRLSEGALRAFVATVRTLGALCGTLGHASASGAEFREEFLDGRAARAFREAELGGWLQDRPFRGLTNDEYPLWGGLTAAETAALLAKYKEIEVDDPDMEDWLNDLHDALAYAGEQGTDIVTLYL